MKRVLPLFLLVLVLLLCGACTTERERQQMAQVIAEADSMNRNYVPMTSDSLLLEACRYYDRHGTANERMRAHYLLGCIYRDLGRLPETLSAFQDATDRADTTATDCDYKTLSRVYGQSGALFYYQQLPYNALQAFQSAYNCAKHTSEAWVQANFREQQGKCYYDLQLPDSAALVLEDAIGMYLTAGDTLRANTAKGPLAYILMQRGDYVKAKDYMDAYEFHSLYDAKAPQISDDWKLLLVHKGCYNQGIARYDSALHYYYEAVRSTVNPNNRSLAYRGLYETYALLHRADSACKYAVMHAEANNMTNRQNTSRALLSMHHLYNYSRFQALADRKAAETSQANLRAAVLLFSLLLLVALSAFSIVHLRSRRNSLRQRMYAKYTADILSYYSTKKELQRLQSQNAINEHRAYEAKEDLDRFRKSIMDVRRKYDDIDSWGLKTTLAKTAIVKHLKTEGIRGHEASETDMRELRRTFGLYLPSFSEAIQSFGYHLSTKDISICMLIKLDFAPYEICSLLKMSNSALSNQRKRLLKRMFDIDGSSTLFDEKIRELSIENEL